MNLYLIALSTKYSDGWATVFVRDVFTDKEEADRALNYYADVFAPGPQDAFPKCLQIIDAVPNLLHSLTEM